MNKTSINTLSIKHILNHNKGLKIITNVKNDVSAVHPLQFIIQNGNTSSSWNIPYVQNNQFQVHTVNRVLCILKNDKLVDLSMVLSTFSEKHITASIKIEDVPEYFIEIEKNYTFNVASGSPTFHYVDLTNVKGYLIVSVTSDDNTCGKISIHPLVCPLEKFLDLEDRSQNIAVIYQTMLGTGSFAINTENYVNQIENGLFIKFTTYESSCKCNPELCGNKLNNTNIGSTMKTFSLKVSMPPPEVGQILIIATLSILGISIIMAILMFIHINSYTNKLQMKKKDNMNSEISMIGNETDNSSTMKSPRNFYESNCSYQQNEMYVWLVVIMGVSFIVPSLQLVIKHQQYLEMSGDRDLCYFNYLCSIPVSLPFVMDFHDSGNYSFNHIFSNIGYVIFGVVFLLIVWYKHYCYKKHISFDNSAKGRINVKKGIPQYFGIYYALGFALISEGILSACYHTCPTNENFQFDATFMYVTATLLIIKTYQFRHPNVSCNADRVFYGISLVIILNALGAYGSTFLTFTLAMFTVSFIYFIFKLSFILYHAGKWRPLWQMSMNCKVSQYLQKQKSHSNIS